MTIILEQQPPTFNHLIVKRAIQRGDRVIFQWEDEVSPDDHNTALYEKEIIVDDVQTEPGLMKGWCCISWEAAKGV